MATPFRLRFMCSSGNSDIPCHSVTMGRFKTPYFASVLLHYLQLGVWENMQDILVSRHLDSSFVYEFSSVFRHYLPKISDLFEFEPGMFCEFFLFIGARHTFKKRCNLSHS